jgi:hypothetical protein
MPSEQRLSSSRVLCCQPVDREGFEWLGGVVSGLAWVVATIAVMPISAQGPVAALFLPVIELPLPLAALAALGGGRR